VLGVELPQEEEESYNAVGSPNTHPYLSVVVVVQVVTVLATTFGSPKLQLKLAESNAIDLLPKLNIPTKIKIVIIKYFITG
jgi:hypothetical protein